MTRALVAAILAMCQILACTCAVCCQQAPHHASIAAAEQTAVSGHDHHSHGHDASTNGARWIAAAHHGCDKCGAEVAPALSIARKVSDPPQTTSVVFVSIEPAHDGAFSQAADGLTVRGLPPDTSPPALTLSPLRI